MLSTLKLKAARIQADIPIKEIAKRMGVNPATVYRKFDGKSEFTTSELLALKCMLGLDNEKFCDIFFSSELTKTQDSVS